MFAFMLASVAIVSEADNVAATSFYKATGGAACLPQDRIFDQSECESAGKKLGHTFSKVTSSTDRPAGCFWDKKGFSYLNTNSASSGNFWGGVGGLCNQDLQHFDLRTTFPGCGTEILNQGGCGSCWAFGTIEAVSDRFCMMGEKITVSPQTLVSCPDLNGSCRGGAASTAYGFITSHGLPTCTNQCSSGCEPYGSGPNHCASGQTDVFKDRCYTTKKDCGEQCLDGSSAASYKVRSHVRGKLDTDEDTVKAQLRAHGSVTAGLSVYRNWGGWVKNHGADAVYDSHEGSPHVGAHSIKISGFGVSQGKKYWLVQNSWGAGFADGGYIKMLRNTTNSEENGILWDKVDYAMPVLQSAFVPEELSEVSPSDQIVDESPTTGGWMTADHAHPDFRQLAQTVLQEVNAPGDFMSLARVETQVVAGFNARFSIETSEGPLRIETQFDVDGTLRSSPVVSSLVV